MSARTPASKRSAPVSSSSTSKGASSSAATKSAVVSAKKSKASEDSTSRKVVLRVTPPPAAGADPEFVGLACAPGGMGGLLPSENVANTEEAKADKPAWGMFVPDGRKRARSDVWFVSETARGTRLTGRNFAREQKSSSNRYLVFAVNGDEAKLINPSEGSQILMMMVQHAELPPSEDSDEEDEEANADAGLEYAELNKRLVEEFGSRKSQRTLSGRAATRVQSDNVASKDALANLFAGAVKAEKEDSAAAAEAAKSASLEEGAANLLPPANVSANTPEEIYALDSFFLPVEQRYLTKDVVEDALKAQGWSKTEYWGFYLSSIEPFLQSSSQSMAQLAVFMGYLIRFNRKSSSFVRDAASASVTMGVPETIVKSILGRLAIEQSGGFARTKQCKDRTTLTILLCALRLSGFELDRDALLALAQDLAVEVAALSPFLHAIGATPKHAGDKRVWVLQIPFTVPTLVRTFKRRR